MDWIRNNPVVVGTLIKAALVAGTIVGLHTTEADREAVVAAVIAVAAAVAALTTKERASVTPVVKVQEKMEQVVRELDPKNVGVLGNITQVGRDTIDRVLS